MKKKILVIGAGFLGSKILEIGNVTGYEVVGTSRIAQNNTISLDISNIDEAENLLRKINPDYVINCASRNEIDFLESHADLAMQVNSVGARNVAKICSDNKVRLVHISTDSVFDGAKGWYSENDKPNPLNIYSKSKYEGELMVSSNINNYVIVRTNFYGVNKNGKYFFNWILDNIKSNKTMTGFSDVIFSPLGITTLAKMIVELLEIKYNGILHLSSGKTISKFDFISKVVSFLGKSTSLVRQGRITDMKLPARRPLNTSLRNDLSKKLLKTEDMGLYDWLVQNSEEILKYLK